MTSALPYINGIKHLGNFVGSMLPADVYARFLRQEGETVLFICATDEHGTPTEIAASEAGLDVETFCQRMHEVQAEIYRNLGLSFDYFGRNSSVENHELTQHFYQSLNKNGLIEEREMSLVYSLDDERFLPDRYIIGTCPHCGYQSARGDQCENCTSLLDPPDLIEPRSAISGSKRLEVRKTKHLFLKLSALVDEVKAWVEAHPNWSNLTKSIAMKWLNEGLKDRCITRDIAWGVPVPRPGFEGKVFYVWFDAPIGYISATKAWGIEHSQDWETWWRDSESTKYVQFMAKDNLPFHTIMFPAMILGTRENWKLADQIRGFNWLTYYGGKFSTSAKRGIFLDQALSLYEADYWRYSLLSMIPESADSAFTWELFQVKVNKELADTLGNFVNRTLKFTVNYFDATVPEDGCFGLKEQELQNTCKLLVNQYCNSLKNMEFRKAVEALCSLWSVGNQYIDAAAPWKVIKVDREGAAQVVRACLHLIRIYALVSAPIIPFTSVKLFDALHLSEIDRMTKISESVNFEALSPGHEIHAISPLFRKLEEEEVQELSARFGMRE
ncbi:methionine--tRNA ligase [Scytonema hofmannii PCC 7110]|uniref:Methionine--tRNA ligase n=1 Tax=Scytonema hofmannii PCC 7110 TaxID=128403 RepID=A0A139WRM5_9CYAN|nr:methionine--tRNA ligase [Scytonema hofmannii PCC 7110]